MTGLFTTFGSRWWTPLYNRTLMTRKGKKGRPRRAARARWAEAVLAILLLLALGLSAAALLGPLIRGQFT